MRDHGSAQALSDIQTSAAEKAVAAVIDGHVTRWWRAAYGRDPSVTEGGAVLRAIWVQELDIEDGERDQLDALDKLRGNVLATPSQATTAFSTLASLCARLRADRSGVDVPRIQQVLADAGIGLEAMADFRPDIVQLKSWSAQKLARAPRFTRLLEFQDASVIERAVWPLLAAAAANGSLVVVGEPGAGKSGVMYRLAASLTDAGRDVVFLPVDLLNVETFAGLRAELGISCDLPEVLRNWPGTEQGLLIVDALDAARKLETQTILRESIAQIQSSAGVRWNVVASIRRYDLRQGLQWAQMFRGSPPVAGFADGEFMRIKHVALGGLTEAELTQTTSFSPELHALYMAASAKLKALLKNIFNLHLLAELLDAGVVGSALSTIKTQVELLDEYWKYRVRRSDGRHSARDAAITAVLQKMIKSQSLRVFRSDISASYAAELSELEAHDILRAEETAGGTNEDILLFSHHVLFDYAVARLIFRKGRDAAALVTMLKANRALALMLGPSLSLAVHDVWAVEPNHGSFWNLSFALAEGEDLPGSAQLVAPMAAAELAANLNDLAPLIEALPPGHAKRKQAEHVARALVGALFVRQKSGSPLTGPDAGPWMEFAEALAGIGTDEAILIVRPLLAVALQEGSNDT